MATKLLKKDKELGFTDTEFELTIKKPSSDSVWVEHERKINGKIKYGLSKDDEVAAEFGEKIKKTIECFLQSSFDACVITGKIVKKTE